MSMNALINPHGTGGKRDIGGAHAVRRVSSRKILEATNDPFRLRSKSSVDDYDEIQRQIASYRAQLEAIHMETWALFSPDSSFLEKVCLHPLIRAITRC